jgi:hypothetical protein
MTHDFAMIDVWNVDTFDGELRGDLDVHADVIRDYMLTSRRQWLEHEASDHTMPYPENPFAGEFMLVKEHIMRLMEARTIRAWHYTRLTDAEIDALRKVGIYTSSLESIRSRFATQVAAGTFTLEVAERLFADSPYQSGQIDSRSNKFWMVSHPVEIDNGGVKLLLESWGGESAYFWQQDAALQAMLMQIGRPRVLEIAMPLIYSRHGYSAAEAVVATYGRMLGCQPDKHAFDLYTQRPLGPAHILAVHSSGEPKFSVIARGYPDGFRNAD